MNEVMSFLSSLGTTQILGIGGLTVAVIGLTSLKIIKNKKQKTINHLEESKPDIINNSDNQDLDFSTDTYIVNTDENMGNFPKIAAQNLHPNNEIFANPSKNDSSLYILVTNNNEKNNLETTPKHLIANKDSLNLIKQAIEEDKKQDKKKAIEILNLAMDKELNLNEKLRFSTILKNYSSKNDSLNYFLDEYPSFLAVADNLNFLSEEENEDDFNNAKENAQLEKFNYKTLPPVSVERFSHLENSLIAPKITLSVSDKTFPKILQNPPEIPNILNTKSEEGNFPDHNIDSDITKIFKNISSIQSTKTKEENMNEQNTKIADDFNNLLNDLLPNTDNNSKELPAERKEFSQNRLSYDIWVQWMTTANGKTSFKNSMFKLKNPWTSRKAILELSNNLTSESKNSDGSNAAWSVISVQPFFDI